jgi:hypothetical protein
MSAPEFCYSRDGESFQGRFKTREEAISEAEAEVIDDLHPGESSTIYTGEVRRAMHFLRKMEKNAGVHVLENLEQWLADNYIASDDQIIELSTEKTAELGRVIVDFIDANATFRRWGVEEVQEHEFIVPQEGGAA